MPKVKEFCLFIKTTERHAAQALALRERFINPAMAGITSHFVFISRLKPIISDPRRREGPGFNNRINFKLNVKLFIQQYKTGGFVSGQFAAGGSALPSTKGFGMLE
jgi:hypothetical protein